MRKDLAALLDPGMCGLATLVFSFNTAHETFRRTARAGFFELLKRF